MNYKGKVALNNILLTHGLLFRTLKVMKSQNEYMKLSHFPKYEGNIREISALENYID